MIAALEAQLARLPDPLAIAVAVLLLGVVVNLVAWPGRPLARFFCQLAFFGGFSVMLVIGGATPTQPTATLGWTLTSMLTSALKMAWWFAAAWLLVDVVRAVLVYKRTSQQTRLLQDLLAGFIYIGAGLAVVAFVFDRPVSGLLEASGVIAIVLGLALQSTLGDVFSGIVLNLAKPCHPGDWISLDGVPLAQVIETNWRATMILSDNNDLMILPNSMMAKARLTNFSLPTPAHGISIILRLDPALPPAAVCATLDMALLSCSLILRRPLANVTVQSLDAVALACAVQVFIPSIALEAPARVELFDRLYHHLGAAGMRLAPPAGSAMLLPPQAARRGPPDADLLLQHLPIFAPLSDAERQALAPKLRRRQYKAGDVLIKAGEVATALVILTSGVLVARQRQGKDDVEVARLAPGDSFGQAGVLTGAASLYQLSALTRVAVTEIDKVDLVPILKQRPAIAAALGQILAQRGAAEKARLEDLSVPDKHGEPLAAWFTERVKSLFGLG